VHCAAAADSIEMAWHEKWHATHSTERAHHDIATMETVRATTLRSCLAEIRPESLATRDLSRLAGLDAQTSDWPAVDSIADLYVRRSGPTAAGRAAALVDLMQTLLGSPDRARGRTRILSYATRIDAMGSPAAPKAIEAHVWLAQIAGSPADVIREASRAIVLGDSLPKDARRKIVRPLGRAYNFVAVAYGDSFEPDSAKIVAKRGLEAMSALGFGPGDTTALFFWARVLAQTAERYALIGAPAPGFSSGRWVGSRGPSTAFPSHSGISLVEFTADWCVPCRESYPTLIQWHHTYGSRGLHLILATELSDDFEGKTLTKAAWIAAARRYFIAESHIPFPIHIDLPDSTKVLPADSAAVDAMTGYPRNPFPTTRHYVVQAIPQLVLIDRTGTVRQIITGWDSTVAAKLRTHIEALLGEELSEARSASAR
jgi:thiol-disulfide isomerase/thioredoxin